jgi:hypothetical protein
MSKCKVLKLLSLSIDIFPMAQRQDAPSKCVQQLERVQAGAPKKILDHGARQTPGYDILLTVRMLQSSTQRAS